MYRYHQFCSIVVRKVFLWTVSNDTFSRIKTVSRFFCFQPQSSRVEGGGNYIYHRPVCAHHFALLYTSSSRAKSAGRCKVSRENPVTFGFCEAADAPASFNSDVWQHFGFLASIFFIYLIFFYWIVPRTCYNVYWYYYIISYNYITVLLLNP